MTSAKKYGLLLFKVALIGLAIYLVLTRSDLDKIKNYLSHIPLMILVISFALIVLAQIVSALRSQYYFNSIGLRLNTRFVIGLYFTGCLYNSFLPGGISGDGYKIYLLGKLSHVRRVTIFRILVSERASGLLWLLLFLYAFIYLSGSYTHIPYGFPLLCSAVPVTLIGYLLSTRWLLKENWRTSLKASIYSFIIHGIAMLVSLLILYTFHETTVPFSTLAAFLMLFCLSNVLTVLPISIGGIGIRELAFLYGSPFLLLSPEPGIALSLVYFSLSTLMALNGFFFWHKLTRLYTT